MGDVYTLLCLSLTQNICSDALGLLDSREISSQNEKMPCAQMLHI